MPQPVIRLDRRVTIEEELVTQDAAFSSNVPTWRVVDTFHAEVVDQAPSRSLALRQGIEGASLQVRVRVRYSAKLATSTRKRIRFGARVLQVVAGPAEMGRREFMEFLAEDSTTVGGG